MNRRAARAFQDAFFRSLTPSHGIVRLFDYLQDVGLFIKDAEGRFVKVNKPTLEKLGFRREEDVVGLTDYDMVPRYLADIYARDDQRLMASGKPLANKIELVVSEGRTVAWHVTSKIPLLDRSGTPVGVAGLSRFFKKAAPAVPAEARVWPAIEHIQANYMRRMTVTDLGGRVSMSVSTFERTFRKVFHMSPFQYVRMVRVREACRALVGGKASIACIAYDTGFADQSHLTREFTKLMGMTPSRYRRDHSTTVPP